MYASLCFAGDPIALVVLVEEELVVVDLQTEGWPVFQTPYLVPLHCSAITCSHHVSSIPLKLWERVHAAGKLQNTSYSRKVFGTQETQTCTSLLGHFVLYMYYMLYIVQKLQWLYLQYLKSKLKREAKILLITSTKY